MCVGRRSGRALDPGQRLAVSRAGLRRRQHALETAASWLVLVAGRSAGSRRWRWSRGLRRLPALLDDLPLAELDERATGAEVAWFREGMRDSSRDDAYWVARDFSAGVGWSTRRSSSSAAGTTSSCRGCSRTSRRCDAAGHAPQLIIGPWTHTVPGLVAAEHARRDRLAAGAPARRRPARPRSRRARVRHRRGRRRLARPRDWPPPGTRSGGCGWPTTARSATRPPDRRSGARPLPLRPGRPDAVARRPGAARRASPSSTTARSRHATTFDLHDRRRCPRHWRRSGPSRRAVLPRERAVLRRVRARVRRRCRRHLVECLRCARPRRPGRFEQLADGSWPSPFELWPTAHRFAAGHRIRLQVSSGAHPRYARNPGTDERPERRDPAGRGRARGAPRRGAPLSRDAVYAASGMRIPRPCRRPPSRSAIASLIASSGYVLVCSLTLPWAVSVINSARSV